MKNIILIGMPGTGKSTVGVILAKLLGYDFLDCDILIIKKSGNTLPELLDRLGIEGFLKLEGQVGEEISCDKTVIATGGSMVYSAAAMESLKKHGLAVWLDTEPEELERRINLSSNRGIAADKGASILDIYTERKPLYMKYADIYIKCEGSTDNVVKQVKDELIKRALV